MRCHFSCRKRQNIKVIDCIIKKESDLIIYGPKVNLFCGYAKTMAFLKLMSTFTTGTRKA